MLEARWRQRLCEAAEHIVMWASSDGTRCVLAFLEGVLELRLENDGEVMRRAHYIDMRAACDAARQWRIDWDIESRWRRVLNSRIICPECGDEAGTGALRASAQQFDVTPFVGYETSGFATISSASTLRLV